MQNAYQDAQPRRLNNSGRKFLIGAIVLTMGAFLSKFLGAFYRFPLTNILASNGMGIYQMVYPLYSLLLVVSSSGVPVALGVLIAENLQKGNYSYVRKLEKTSIVFVCLVGLFLSLIVYFFSGTIASLQGNYLGRLGYMALAPSILIVSVISAIRGIFQGRQNMLPTALSQICEQVVKILFGLFLANKLSEYGVEYAVMGALLAVTISELISLVFLIIFLKKRKSADEKKEGGETFNYKKIIKDLIKIALPITLNSAVLPLSLFFDSVVIINLLKVTLSTSTATSLYGIFSGVVMVIINLPVVISTSLSTSLVPALSKAISAGDKEKQQKIFETSKNIILWVCLPCVAFFIFAGFNIISLIFSKSLISEEILLASRLLAYLSVTTILLSFLQLYSSVVQCYKRAVRCAFNLVLGVLIKTVLIILTTRFLGVYAVCVGYILGYLLTTILDYIEVRKVVKVGVGQEIIKIGLSTINAVLLFFILKNLAFSFIFIVFLVVLFYLVHMFIFEAFKNIVF